MPSATEPPDAREFDTQIRVDDLDPERPRPIVTPWGAFSLIRLPDGVATVQSFCPHLGGPLFQGTLSRDTLTCPWHLWRFSLRTGLRVDLGALGSGRARLARCAGRAGERGTWILAPPDQRPYRIGDARP